MVLGVNKLNSLTGPPLKIDYTVGAGGDIQIRVLGVSGETVRHLISGTLAQGSYTIYWDGKDDKGEAVATGLYVIAVKRTDKDSLKKVLVVRR